MGVPTKTCTLLFVILSNVYDMVSSSEVAKHLEMGMQLLHRGAYQDALSHYHAAIEGDDSNYQSYYWRATVYLALGKSKLAVEDLNKVIDLKEDFIKAREQRGNILLKQGYLDEAHIDFEYVLRLDPHNLEALHHYEVIEQLKNDIAVAMQMRDQGDCMGVISILQGVLEQCPWNLRLRELRAECYEAIGDLNSAISDLRPAIRSVPDNTKGYLKLARLFHKHGEPEEGLTTIRECLKLDPDHKECMTFYKSIKKLVAQIKSMQDLFNAGKYGDCLEKGKQALSKENTPAIVTLVKTKQCHCASKGGAEDAVNLCSEALRYDPQNPNILCDRAEAYLNADDFANAKQDFASARELDQENQRAAEGLKRAQKLEKAKGKRDYYKILGVKRTASKGEITKAYRKLAAKWHPDQYQGDDKKGAEKMFIDIAAAKEVLTDPEKRAKFDRGEDPLDPDSGRSEFNPFGRGGFNPFSGGGGGGGGGGFHYTFHF
ncbi:dnaJ homolog subfamily C member 3 [Galendromus occidentalis]|uniref:DnaJ homolog subfamily C member 3 n=1 Tax=Galendromus occidentalis TaxID=34638 RepID=A0AAJ6VXA5_9ACAR|nr:dnaJ homolog subfamily C member 3 [Galendromus occidentalis]